MSKEWRPSRDGRAQVFAPGLFRLALLIVVTLAGLFTLSCERSDILEPGSVESNAILAYYIPQAVYDANPMMIDGVARQREWGGPQDPERPFTQIRLTAEQGSGFPGNPIYVSAKAFYTDRDLYMLFQWADPYPNTRRGALAYVGPDMSQRRGCQPTLTEPSSWYQTDWGEDWLAVAFEIEAAGRGNATFRESGCQIACHSGQSPAFGRTGYGRLDVWAWYATRTNPLRNLYNRVEDPNFPVHGTPGFLEDYMAGSVQGLLSDPGTAGWKSNVNNVGRGVRPLQVYRPVNDPFANPASPDRCFNLFGEKCVANNRLPYYYIWREDDAIPIREFSECDTINYATLPQGQEARKWRYGDLVGGYTYTYPGGSRAHVRGKALHSDGVWTLEVARPLDTGDPVYDIIFKAPPGSTQIPEAWFTVSVGDNSVDHHWGSGPQVLRFAPRTAGRPAGDGGE